MKTIEHEHPARGKRPSQGSTAVADGDGRPHVIADIVRHFPEADAHTQQVRLSVKRPEIVLLSSA